MARARSKGVENKSSPLGMLRAQINTFILFIYINSVRNLHVWIFEVASSKGLLPYTPGEVEEIYIYTFSLRAIDIIVLLYYYIIILMAR